METACESLLEKEDIQDGHPDKRKHHRTTELSLRGLAVLFAVVQICLVVSYTSVFLLLKKQHARSKNIGKDWEFCKSPCSR
jgi:hypothetical protein